MSRACKYRLSMLLVGIVLLAGCAGDGLFKKKLPPPAEPAEIETGSQFTLSAPLKSSPGASALFFQDNQLVSPDGIAQSYPYCKLVSNAAETLGVVSPATFVVQNVEYDDNEIGVSGSAVSVTRILLASGPTQSYTLSCQWPDGGGQGFLTSEEIQGVIGAYFTLALQR